LSQALANRELPNGGVVNITAHVSLTIALAFSIAATASAGDASEPAGEPVLEMPTLHSLGVYWIIRGDDNGNARIEFEYRKAESAEAGAWHKAPPLWRVEKGAHKNRQGRSSVEVPEDAWLFAGSALLLEPDTLYDLKLTLIDPDGGTTERYLKQATIGEPVAPADMRQLHVVPGDGGGTGTADDPYRGLTSAMDAAAPGTVLLLHRGVYDGPIRISRSGEPGRPIIWRAAGDGEAIVDGGSPPDSRTGTVIDVSGMHDVWFEGITIANAWNGIKAHGAQRIVVRRCHIHNCNIGFFATMNEPRVMSSFFISDNVIVGPIRFPATADEWHRQEARGVWIGGQGHVVCYNRITNMEDGVTTAEAIPCVAIDFHNNDCHELIDDGAELDGSERNVRNFLNRYANSLVGLSFQPIYGGPVYAFRNVCYNFRTEATKLHNGPSGMVLVHNTFVKFGPAWWMDTPVPVRNCYSRNNLFIGTEGPAVFFGPSMINCDFDYDGFGGWSGNRFMRFNGSFRTPEEARANASIQKHMTLVDPATLFASGIQTPTPNPDFDPETTELGYGTLNLNTYPVELVDLRLNPASAAVGAGERLSGYGDDPDAPPYLGAYAPGEDLPQYGPRPIPHQEE
jgi:hypothetical protein